jgi:hypothetical protein
MKINQNLVANERFQPWWSMGKHLAWWWMEGSKLSHLSKVKDKHPFYLFSFSPQQILFKLFSLDFKVLLYHDFRSLFYVFPSFSLTYKLYSRILIYQVFHTLIPKLILIKDFFLSLNSRHRAWPQFISFNPHKWMKITLRMIPKFDTNLAPSWWRSQTMRDASLSRN